MDYTNGFVKHIRRNQRDEEKETKFLHKNFSNLSYAQEEETERLCFFLVYQNLRMAKEEETERLCFFTFV